MTQGGGPAAFPDDSLTGVHVLVIDDNRDSRDILHTVLDHFGALVTTAASAHQAEELLSHVVPDAIVCDIAMPEKTGYAFVRDLRITPHGRTIPVVAISAYGRLYSLATARDAGFDAFLSKPVDPVELARTLGRLVAERRRRTA